MEEIDAGARRGVQPDRILERDSRSAVNGTQIDTIANQVDAGASPFNRARSLSNSCRIIGRQERTTIQFIVGNALLISATFLIVSRV